MAPYASSYAPPAGSTPAAHEPPVIITMALGNEDHQVQMMDIDDDTEEEQVVRSALEDVRKELASKGGSGGMDVDATKWIGKEAKEAKEGRTGSERTIVVLDTNVFIRHLSLLRDLVDMIISIPSSSTPIILIPLVVLRELDGLKTQRRRTSEGLGIDILARSATSLILETIEAQQSLQTTIIRLQSPEETMRERSRHDRQEVGSNDDLVLDAAEYHGKRAVLLTDDKILLVKAHASNVAALSIDRAKVREARSLLGLFAPDLAEAAPEPPPRFLTTSSPPSPSRRRSSRSIPFASSRKVVPIPIPLTSPPPRLDSMEIESEFPPPPRERPLRPPNPRDIKTPSDVFYDACDVLAHLLAYDVYWHVFDHLYRTRPKEQADWLVELGDWRYWDGAGCIEALKKWWVEGDIKSVCLKGLDPGVGEGMNRFESGGATEEASGKPTSPPPLPPPNPANRTNGESRSITSSRWAVASCKAASGTNSTPLGNRSAATPHRARSPPPVPFSPRPPPSHIKDPPPPSRKYFTTPLQRLQAFYLSLARFLPGGHTSLRSDPDQINEWKSWKWELLLEGMEEVLVVVLGALIGDVKKEAREEVRRWVKDLKKVGIEASI